MLVSLASDAVDVQPFGWQSPGSWEDAENSKIISGYSSESPDKPEAMEEQAPAGQVHILGPGLL